MAWNIFGRDTTPEQLPADLRAILAEMKRERVAFEDLTTNARESANTCRSSCSRSPKRKR